MNTYSSYQQPLQYPAPPHYGSDTQNQESHAEAYLRKAFPKVNHATIKAILSSTNNQIDPAYNALSAISGSSLQTSFSPPSHYAPSYDQPILPPPPPRYGSEQSTSTNYNSAPVQSSYLSPSSLAPCGHFSNSDPNAPNHSGSITPMYPPSSPNLQPSYNSTPHQQHGAQSSSQVPDMSQLSLHGTPQNEEHELRHYAYCDGCRADPIKGTRWNCLACADYDLCDECRWGGIHNHHRLVQVRLGAETHHQYSCDGCKVDAKSILGTRYACQKHENEDWCERCVKNGKACGGPYKEVRQTEMGMSIERYGALPMPEDWLPYLRPAVATYNIEERPNAARWIDWPPGLAWFDKPKRDRLNNPVDPIFTVEMKNTKGRVISDHKYSWTMKNARGAKLFTYLLETDRKTNAVKKEQFGDSSGKSSVPLWKDGGQQDSLSFQDPRTGTQYRWLSNRPISTLDDERFDFQRNALFKREGGKESIVADWTWWDGKKDAEDCLAIRDPTIDHAMVMASLCVVHDYQWRVMAEELERDPAGVTETEAKARLTARGLTSYWYLSDFGETVAAGKSGGSTTAQKLMAANQVVDIANNVLGIVSAANGGGGS